MLPARVTRFAKRGDIPCVVLPDGEYRFLAADLEAWVENYRRDCAATEGGSDG